MRFNAYSILMTTENNNNKIRKDKDMTKKEFMSYNKVKRFYIINNYHNLIRNCYAPEVRDDLKKQVMRLIFNNASCHSAKTYDDAVEVYGIDWCRYERLKDLPISLNNFYN